MGSGMAKHETRGPGSRRFGGWAGQGRRQKSPGVQGNEAISSSSALASFRSTVSKPSVSQPYTGVSSSRACCGFPWSTPQPSHARRRARLPGFCLLFTCDRERPRPAISVRTKDANDRRTSQNEKPYAECRYLGRRAQAPVMRGYGRGTRAGKRE